ncbi:hypothetical protein GWK47_030680 [Chionoecetes opilio]|uniref:Uncharacterized protein n=1 Tax=Chionoecetes opilio TaxID=41210 RepID=A0A8J4YRM1_CHIOP|nr:hypothetical protein GWK47_030680 [Chionoecetes opilio]
MPPCDPKGRHKIVAIYKNALGVDAQCFGTTVDTAFLSSSSEISLFCQQISSADIGSPPGWEENSFLQSMPSVVSGQREVHSATSSTALQGVIHFFFLWERGKTVLGKHGGPIPKSRCLLHVNIHMHKHPGLPGVPDAGTFQVVIYDKPPLVSVNEAKKECSARKKERGKNSPQIKRPRCAHQTCVSRWHLDNLSPPNKKKPNAEAAVGHWMGKKKSRVPSGARSPRQQRGSELVVCLQKCAGCGGRCYARNQ